jgi:DNA primase
VKFDSSRVDVIDFLEALGVENVTEATEAEVKFSCPFPGHQHGDQRPSAYMNRRTTAWYCHSCHRKGNSITFLAEIGTISIMEAVRYLKERYGGASADPDSVSMRDELERWYAKKHPDEEGDDPPLPVHAGEDWPVAWSSLINAEEKPAWGEYMLNRGFSPVLLEAWDIGFDPVSNRITIPILNHRKELIGFKGRAWDDRKPKYLVLGSGQWDRYHVSRVVFGLYNARPGELIVQEGELNTIALEQMNIPNAVSVNGSNFSKRQADLIRSVAESVIVYFDSNQAGWEGTNLVCEALRPYMPVKVVPDHEGDPADALRDGDADSVRELLQDAKSETAIRLEARMVRS